jgi:hypothetical protein
MKVSRMFSFMTAAIIFGASSMAAAQAPGGQQPGTPGTQQPGAQGGSTQKPAPGTPTQSQSSAQQTMTMTGELVSVDTDERTFIVMQAPAGAASGAASGAAQGAASGAAQGAAAGGAAGGAAGAAQGAAQSAQSKTGTVEFRYNDDTQVTGAQKGIEGLAAAKASRVTVTYRQQGNDRIATRIDVMAAGSSTSQPKPAAPASTPGSQQPGAKPGTQQPGQQPGAQQPGGAGR